ncbi:hypothetical protein [Celeribacter arenosi]|uniref:DUF2178 domain-containing protein n=1 Tax=Celeribacter arenosi TaxID=792649 RepID=A0ABP7K9M7_9RHOB
MSFQERMSLTVMTASTVAYIIFMLLIGRAWNAGRFEGPEGLVYTGKTLLIFIAIFIVLTVGSLIIQAIFETVLTGEEDAMDEGEDERDRAYEFQSLRIQSIVSGVFFCASLGALWAGFSGPVAIHLIFFGFFIGMIAGELRKFLLYREG